VSKVSALKELEAGYTVTCVAYPLSDCTLQTHQEKFYINRLFIFRRHHNPHASTLPLIPTFWASSELQNHSSLVSVHAGRQV